MAFNGKQLLGQDGLLAKKLPGYEYRQEQIEMAEHVYTSLENKNHSIIEAGTGVGKSLAYLLPLIYYTVEQKERAVVATHTITLQEQLFHKDIPLLQDILDLDFHVEVFKGRGNYLCLRNWEEVAATRGNQLKLLGEDHLDKLAEWVDLTQTGDFNEAPINIPWELLAEIRCEKASCPGDLCPYFTDCFYFKLRHRLEDAHLIITNQAMLLADARSEGHVLPEFAGAVIDEAHNLDEVATGAFSHELKRENFLTLYRLGVQLQGSLRGAIPEYIIQDLYLILEELIKEAGQYFTELEPLITNYTVPVTEENRSHFGQTSLPKHLQDLLEILKECNLEEEDEAFALVEQFADFTKQLLNTLDLILHAQDGDYVYWAEIQNGEPCLLAAPIDVSSVLQETLFKTTPSVILTSATLSTNQSFAYIEGQLGLNHSENLILGSPFAYEEQALLCVPKEAKNPNHPRYPHYAAYLILKTAAHTKGGVLVLFTSYSLMDEIAETIRPKLDEVGYHLFKQGDGPRLRLIQEFQDEPRSLLFGTNTFWEGIDLPGKALKAVVITRLPFTVPDRPVTAARLKAVEERGGNPFLEYSVPQAILRLKQGFGRLIRSKTDVGGVVILDERIITTAYGSQFLKSLPQARFTRNLEDLEGLFT